MSNQFPAENSQLQPIAKTKKTTGSPQARWQLLVISGANACSTSPKNIRIDAAHTSPMPHFSLGWSQQVGWHSPLAAAPVISPKRTLGSAHNSIVAGGVIAAPKFQMAARPQANVVAVPTTDQDIESRLLELAQQLADDIRGPLAASHEIVANISSQVRINSYLSADDAGQLAAVSQNLVLISQWTECILLRRQIEEGGLQVIRSRFAPEDWRVRILGVLESIARPKNIKIQWTGWDTELPLLYLDANHLTQAVINLVANAVAASEPNSAINIRASWQHNVTGRLMITIEDNGIGLPATLMKILNSSAADSSRIPSRGNALQAARQLISGNGGLIAAQHGPGGGTVVRISLPVDNYASLIRAWILQNATMAANSEQYRVALFAIRCGQTECGLFNSHLQRSATARQFVYRVAENRWLVLELKAPHEGSDSRLMSEAEKMVPTLLQESQPWLSQSVFVSLPFALDGLLGRSNASLRLPQLTEQLVEKFEELLSHQHSSIDRLTISDSIIPAPHLKRPSSDSVSDSFVGGGPESVEAAPGAKTVNDIVRQWKIVQAKLALLDNHPAMNRQIG